MLAPADKPLANAERQRRYRERRKERDEELLDLKLSVALLRGGMLANPDKYAGLHEAIDILNRMIEEHD